MTTINNTSFSEVVVVVMEDTHPTDVMDIDCSSQPHDYYESQEYNEYICRSKNCIENSKETM